MSATSETELSREEQAAAKLLGVEGRVMWEMSAWTFSGKTYHIFPDDGRMRREKGRRRVPLSEVITVIPTRTPLPDPFVLVSVPRSSGVVSEQVYPGKAYKAPVYVWLQHFTFASKVYVGFGPD